MAIGRWRLVEQWPDVKADGVRERGVGLALTLISAMAMSMREPRTMTKSKLFQGSPK